MPKKRFLACERGSAPFFVCCFINAIILKTFSSSAPSITGLQCGDETSQIVGIYLKKERIGF